jgi:hypothetical protein
MGFGLRRAIAGVAFIAIAVVLVLVWVRAKDSQNAGSGFVQQPVSTPVPSPTAVVSPTPVFDDRIRSLVAAIEAGDADTLFAALRRYYVCSPMISEVPHCPAGSGQEVVAQIGLHIYPAYRDPELMLTWLETLMTGNRFQLVLAANAEATEYRPEEVLFLLFEASPGSQRVDGLAVSAVLDSSLVAELDFYCTRRSGCGRNSSDIAEQVEVFARGKINPDYCDPSYDEICIELRRSFLSPNGSR